MKIFFSTLLCSLFSIVLLSQSPFVLQLGLSTRWEEARAITRTEDGNFMIAGCRTDSNNKRKGLVFKMAPDGTVIWAKMYGGNTLGNTTSGEDFYDIIYLGGYYYCVGSTVNWVNDPSPNVARADVLLVKLKPNGDLVWAKNFGSPVSQTSGSLGNEVGFGLVPNYLGGVLISVRINSGNATNQNTGFISVDTDGKVRWAYQYDLTVNANTNELVDRVWKADHQSYVAGGWYNNFLSNGTGGMLMKLDRDGNLTWSKKTDWTPTTGNLFESMYSGYYNYKNGKIYSTDYYNPGTSTSVRAVNIMTNFSSDGTAPPTTGGNVQAKSIHYATPTSGSNNHRGYLFPVGDGTEYMISSAYSVAYTNGTTYRALLAKVNTDLSQPIAWQKMVGVDGSHNKIVDLIPCDDNNQDMIGVGTVRNVNNYDILVVRINSSETSCTTADTRNHSSLTETTSDLGLQRVNLNSGCPGSCWAENDTITGLSVSSESLTGTFTCAAMKMDAPESQFLDYIIPKVESITGGAKISFGFTKPTVQLIFELKTPTGEIVFERIFDNPAKMEAGLKISTDTGYEAGNYVWTIIATYNDEEGIEIKEGEIAVQ